MSKDIQQIKKKILPILKKAGVRRSAVFGSIAKGEVNKKSDVDILVKISKRISLFDFIDLKQQLEGVLRKKVDLVEYETIKPALKEKILSEQVRIL